MTPYYEREEWPHFLSAIRATPDDDLPRLVAADFVEECGDAERAEFIRVQCAIEGAPIRPGTGDMGFRKWQSLKKRERELWDGNKCRWWGAREFIRYLGSEFEGAEGQYPDSPKTFCSRGFVSRVSGPLVSLHGGEFGCVRAWRLDATSHVLPGGRYRCRGTGRTPGVLGQLLKREPVAAAGIVVTDREPMPASSNRQDSGAIWWDGRKQDGDIHPQSDLPPEVFAVIDGQHLTAGSRLFPTADAARLALGQALYSIHGPKTHEATV